MVGDFVWELGPEIGDTEFVDEEVAELSALVGERLGLSLLRLAMKQLFVEDL